MQGEEYFQNLRPEMRHFLPENRARVLEVGCGEGQFAAAIDGVQEAWGVEPAPEAARIASDRLHRVINATFDDAKNQLPRRYFDLIICNDVIEHMTDHDRFLKEVGEFLCPGGVLVGSVPNVRFYYNIFYFLVRREWEYEDSGILDRTHLRFFTERSLRRALETNGYRVDEMRGINAVRINPWRSLRSFAHVSIMWTLIASTLNAWRDIRYLQFGFRAQPVQVSP